MTKRDIIVIGASAGGVEALSDLVKSFPEKLDACVFIVLHIPEHTESHLDKILQRLTKHKVLRAADGMDITSGTIYVAPTGGHLMIEEDKIVIGRGPKENRFRPSEDALFRSAAYN